MLEMIEHYFPLELEYPLTYADYQGYKHPAAMPQNSYSLYIFIAWGEIGKLEKREEERNRNEKGFVFT